MNKLIMVFLLMFSMSAFATDNQIEQDVQQSVEDRFEKRLTYCNGKIDKYRKKLEKYPDSEYYNWKLQKYIKKCEPYLEREAKEAEKAAVEEEKKKAAEAEKQRLKALEEEQKRLEGLRKQQLQQKAYRWQQQQQQLEFK